MKRCGENDGRRGGEDEIIRGKEGKSLCLSSL
jgi:hypothetical protein